MGKAEVFIENYTKAGTNQIINGTYGTVIPHFHPWLTPDQALRAVEIAKEEMIERTCDAYCKVCGHYAHTTPNHICRQGCDYYMNFKQAIKDE